MKKMKNMPTVHYNNSFIVNFNHKGSKEKKHINNYSRLNGNEQKN